MDNTQGSPASPATPSPARASTSTSSASARTARGGAFALPRVLLFARVSRRFQLGLHWCSPAQLADQLDLLICERYGFLDLAGFLSGIQGARPVEEVVAERKLLLVFDDPYVEFVDLVWPILSARKLPSCLLVASAQVGQRTREPHFGWRALQRLSWSELRELEAQQVTIGSRGHFGIEHDRVPVEVAFGDLMRSCREMERRLGHVPRLLRYGGTRAGTELRNTAYRAGFEVGLSPGAGAPYSTPLGLGALQIRRLDRASGLLRRIARSPVSVILGREDLADRPTPPRARSAQG